MDTRLDSAILEVVANHDLKVEERHFSPVQIHSAIRWRWPWLTDPEDAEDVFASAHELAERGFLEELPPRSGLELFTDYRMTKAGHEYLRDNPSPHECQPPQGVMVDPSMEWICPECRAMFRPRLRLDQIMFHEPSGESHPARWERIRDGTDVDPKNAGRRCQHPGCTTLLSTYNSDVVCWTHAEETTRSRFNRVAKTMTRPLIYRPSDSSDD